MTRVSGQCVCGAVTLEAPAPEFVNSCNCTMCSKLGGLWSYYPGDEVTITGETRAFVRADLTETYLATHHCPVCAAVTHWVPLGDPPHARMGVNARLLEWGTLDGVEVRQCDGRSWDV